MLQLKGVGKRAGRAQLLADIDLSLSQGEIVSILGPTGSGKTSLLRLIMGFDLLDAGAISSDGQRLAQQGKNLVPVHRRGFSMVFQETLLLPFHDVERNIQLGVVRPSAADHERLEQILSMLQLSPLRQRPAADLSGGEQQRVALARSLMARPRLLLLDEPFSNLDLPTKEALFSSFRDYLSREQISTIFVTHDRNEAFFFSQRIVLLHQGRILQQDEPERLYHHPGQQWAAALLGEMNLLAVAEMTALFGLSLGEDDSDTTPVLIRPEHLEISPDPPHNGTLSARQFQGFYQVLHFQTHHGPRLTIKALTDRCFEVGAPHRVQLKNPRFVTKLQ